MKGIERVFVYGTLRRGFENHLLLCNATLLGRGRTKKRYALYLEGIPYLVKEQSISSVVGEVYRVNEETLAALDRLEGHPHLYRREKADILTGDGHSLRAWVYFYPEPRGTLIESGDFRDVAKSGRTKKNTGHADQAEKVKSVRYRVGNLGDLLKHSWLIEILSFLKKQKGRASFYYADAFSGFDEYGIGKGQAERIRKHLLLSPLFEIQKGALSQERYLGSVSIARKVLGTSGRLSVFDTNPLALDCFEGLGIGTLKIKSGYDVLDQKKPYDLIFLDPYDDFLDDHEAILAKIFRKTIGSSVFLFFPFRNSAHEKGILRIIGQSGSTYIHGSAGRGDPLLDGIHRFAVILFPAGHLDGKACRHLTRKLDDITALIQGLRASG